jgi:hypothetical protein
MASPIKLPGGGPWRILSQCPAKFHNSQNSAYGRNGPHCVCPRALSIWRDIVGRGARKRDIPKWLADGPWKILEECEAPTHNTISAARGVIERNVYGTRCICPHAKHLLKAMRSGENTRRKKKVVEKNVGVVEEIKALMNPHDMPDLTDGACAREENRFAVDAGFNTDRTPAGRRDRNRAKAVCELCPLATFQRCQTWVLTKEDPAGSWGGVYGGLDIYDRANVASLGVSRVA